MGGFTFREVDRGYNKLKQALTTLQSGKSYAKAGVIGANASKEHAGGLSTVDLAMVHEFGAPSAKPPVPERSFIRASFEKNRAAYADLLQKLMPKVYTNEMSLEQVLRVIGLRMEADIRNYVTHGAGVPPPNAPSTIERKGSSRPLVDTARMIGSVSSEVVLRGEGDE